MTIKELKETIAALPDDMEVVVQMDSEGNGYNTAEAADPDCVWSPHGDTILSTKHTADQNCLEEEEWARILEKSPRVLVIAP